MLDALEGGVKKAVVEERTINAGRTPTLQPMACMPWNRPMSEHSSPLRGKTTDWRAVCGRSARAVRREGRPGDRSSLPLSFGPIAEAALFSGGKYPAYAEAQTDLKLVSIEKHQFLNLIESKPKMAINMIALLSQRLKNFAHKIEQLSLMGVVPRLAEYIVQNSGDKQHFTLEISKGDLASFLGTVPETLSRAFGKLKAGGYITEAGNVIRINDRGALAEIAESYD